jgi:hypothetical protein
MLYGKEPSKDKLKFPESVKISPEAKSFLQKSLNMNANERLFCKNDLASGDILTDSGNFNLSLEGSFPYNM